MPDTWTIVYDYPSGKRERQIRRWIEGEPPDVLEYESFVWRSYRKDSEKCVKYFKVQKLRNL